jgi:flagellar FliL protein
LGLAGGGAAWFFLMQEPPAKDAKAKEDQQKTKEPPVYATLEPFTVNVKAAEGGAESYLQITIELKVAEKTVTDKVKLHMPEIRNGILLLLTSKNVEELKTTEGKQKLASDIQAAVNKPLGLPGGKGVTGVFFTSFVIQ